MEHHQSLQGLYASLGHQIPAHIIRTNAYPIIKQSWKIIFNSSYGSDNINRKELKLYQARYTEGEVMAPSIKRQLLNLILFAMFINLCGCSKSTPIPPTETPHPNQSPTPLTLPVGSGGGIIAFVTDRNRGRMNLYLINADGSELTQITFSRYDEIAPSWSPDGTNLAYLVSKHDQLDLVILDLGSALSDPLTDHSTLIVEDSVDASPPSWTSDGNMLIYAAYQGENLDLFAINSDGSDKKQLTQTNVSEKHPALSPDGTKLVFSSDLSGTFDLYLIENFNIPEFHSQPTVQLTFENGDELYPTWSPGGDRILYTSTENGNKDLRIIYTDGGNSVTVSSSTADEWKASWSPDGNKIVYSYFNFDNDLNDLHVLGLDTTSSVPITVDNFDNWWPAWKL